LAVAYGLRTSRTRYVDDSIGDGIGSGVGDNVGNDCAGNIGYGHGDRVSG
jgi:hypothetical protein